MKRIMILVALAICCTAVSARAVRIAAPAPDFTLPDISGSKVRLETFRGSVVILNFWSTSCAPCVAELPSLNALSHELKSSGLVVLGISLDSSVKPVREMIAKQAIEYRILLDSDKEVYFDTYSLFGQPVSIIIDRTGTVRDKIVGPVDWSTRQMKTHLQSLLKGPKS